MTSAFARQASAGQSVCAIASLRLRRTRFVLTGRATLYGTAVGGEAGAFKAINLIRNELDKTMAYTGCRSVDEVTTDIFFGGRQGNRLYERVMDEAAF